VTDRGEDVDNCEYGRPVGPGYDMGKSKRPRDEVDPAYRCDFFKWSSDVRRQSTHRGAAS
jgi:AP endonuclease 2